MPVRRRKLTDSLAWLVDTREPQRRKAHPSRPALSPADEYLDVLHRHREATTSHEKFVGLVARERGVLRSQLA